MTIPKNDLPITLSIGITAWNEEASLVPMLGSLLGQSIFARLAALDEGCEIICLANGCTDRTVEVAKALFARVEQEHPDRRGPVCRVAEISEAGKNNAWNRFVHEYSAREARYICLMDADIILNKPDTLDLIVGELERNPRLACASGFPCKDIAGKAHPSLRERLSLAGSDMTDATEGRLSGMLYCMRAAVARNLFLPRDIIAVDDGFLKAAICTDFFRAPVDPSRVTVVRGATHLYEPYLSLPDFLNNQKRQMIGQTTVHVAIEYLKTLPEPDRALLGATLRRSDSRDPDWLKRQVRAHLARNRSFWQLFPGIIGLRWRRLRRMRGRRRLSHLPAAAVGFAATLFACWRASRFLRRGVSAYWPKTARRTIMSPGSLGAK
ncbi:MAG TPA: glycosyltransferase [Opitutaceae bacterium]|nr:glycosyltransferase [Opitutaceae bacterium]